MAGGQDDEPSLSAHERRAIEQIEGRLSIDDPDLYHVLSTGRRMKRRADPVLTGIVATIMGVGVVFIMLLCGPAPGATAAGIAVIVLPVWLLLGRRFGSTSTAD